MKQVHESVLLHLFFKGLVDRLNLLWFVHVCTEYIQGWLGASDF
jgi:hypothetical protein